MNSHEILKKTIAKAGVKTVAADMALSQSLIYKWCQAKGEESSGADNPLDRLLTLCQITGDSTPVVWLCEQINGFFVENITPESTRQDLSALAMTQRILKEFSEMLDMVSQSLRNDGGIDRDEARRIRVEWEDLKRVAEKFVLGCEMGRYEPEPTSSMQIPQARITGEQP